MWTSRLIDIPYRHESTYPVSLDDLLGLLQNLIGTIANPQSRRNKQLQIEPIEAPDFQEFFISLESIIGKYEDLIMKKIGPDRIWTIARHHYLIWIK